MNYIKTPAITQCYQGGFDNRPGWWFHVPYDEQFIEDFKSQVPHTSRSWDEKRSRWWVSVDYEETLLKLLPSFGAYLYQPRLL